MFYKVVKSVAGFFIKFFFKFDVEGLENLPEDGRLMLCPNHISNWDPIVISIVVPRQIFWMGKYELFKNKVLNWFLFNLGVFPVKRGEIDVTAIKTALRLLKDDKILGLFPEGTRVKGYDIENAKPGASLISLKTDTLIVPVYIESDYKFRSSLKIRFGNPKDYGVNIDGKPSQKDHQEISKELLNDIYSLKNS